MNNPALQINQPLYQPRRDSTCRAINETIVFFFFSFHNLLTHSITFSGKQCFQDCTKLWSEFFSQGKKKNVCMDNLGGEMTAYIYVTLLNVE